jgi:endonuclease I
MLKLLQILIYGLLFFSSIVSGLYITENFNNGTIKNAYNDIANLQLSTGLWSFGQQTLLVDNLIRGRSYNSINGIITTDFDLYNVKSINFTHKLYSNSERAPFTFKLQQSNNSGLLWYDIKNIFTAETDHITENVIVNNVGLSRFRFIFLGSRINIDNISFEFENKTLVETFDNFNDPLVYKTKPSPFTLSTGSFNIADAKIIKKSYNSNKSCLFPNSNTLNIKSSAFGLFEMRYFIRGITGLSFDAINCNPSSIMKNPTIRVEYLCNNQTNWKQYGSLINIEQNKIKYNITKHLNDLCKLRIKTNDTVINSSVNLDNFRVFNLDKEIITPNSLCDLSKCINYKSNYLRRCLKEHCFIGKHQTLGYNLARQYLYNFVYNEQTGPNANTVICVYGGYRQPFPYGGTSTNPYPINCEHTVPQSFFRLPGKTIAEEPLRSDMFHLYPTHNIINSARSSYDFGENNDTLETKTWYIQGTSSNIYPNTNLSKYSELTDKNVVRNLDLPRFEPPESHKGNLARAILYIYTMYEEELVSYASVINSTNNNDYPIGYPGKGIISDLINLKTLFAWNKFDQVDQNELNANERIAKYQGNMNPYILNSTLAERAFENSNIDIARKIIDNF